MAELTREQLKAIFAKKRFSKLPEELQGDILDSASPSGVNTTADDWNSLDQRGRESFLDQFKTNELKRIKMEHTNEDRSRQERDLIHNKLTKTLGRVSGSLGMITIVSRDKIGQPETVSVESELGFLASDLKDLDDAGFKVESLQPAIVTSGVSGVKTPQVKIQLEIDRTMKKQFNPDEVKV